MDQLKKTKRIKYARLHAMILPIHQARMEEEISQEASKGRRLTISDIVREELDGRYFATRRKSDSKVGEDV